MSTEIDDIPIALGDSIACHEIGRGGIVVGIVSRAGDGPVFLCAFYNEDGEHAAEAWLERKHIDPFDIGFNWDNQN